MSSSYFEVAVVRRIMQRRVIIQAFGVNLSPGCQQLLGHVIIPSVASLMQCGPA